MSTNVSLDLQRKALFPDRCILCNQRGPGGGFAMSAGTPGWRELVGLPPTSQAVQVPACIRCRGLLERQRQLRGVGMLIAALAAAACYSVLLVSYHGAMLSLVRAGGLVFFMLPYLIWEAVFPLPVQISTTRKKIQYRFEQETFAIEFARLNGTSNSAANQSDTLSPAESAALADAIASLASEVNEELPLAR